MAGIRPTLGEERIAAGEQAMIDEIVRDNVATLERGKEIVPRAQHPKHHGCVKAKFVVEPDLAANLRVGLFEKPTTYDALIRFSNGRQTDDSVADIHGMAIKLLDVPGRKLLVGHENETTHDFILIDHEVFLSVGMSDYAKLNHDIAAAKGRNGFMKKLVKLKLLLLHPGLAIRVKKATAQTPASPLTTNYWSTTPYRLGSQAVKYMAVAQREDRSGVRLKDGLAEALVAHLAIKEARFDFGVHLQEDAVKHPIEDPTVNWSENEAPFHKLATIVIPPQTVDPKADLAENLAFSPWHALEAHRPLGAINRARRPVYEEMAKQRHMLNEISPASSSEVPRQ